MSRVRSIEALGIAFCCASLTNLAYLQRRRLRSSPLRKLLPQNAKRWRQLANGKLVSPIRFHEVSCKYCSNGGLTLPTYTCTLQRKGRSYELSKKRQNGNLKRRLLHVKRPRKRNKPTPKKEN